MQRRNELPSIVKNKTGSHNNIVRAINGLVDYSHYKRRLLSGLKVKVQEGSPLSKRSQSRKLKVSDSPMNQLEHYNRSATLNKVDLVMPKIEVQDRRPFALRLFRGKRRQGDSIQRQQSVEAGSFKIMMMLENLYDIKQQQERQYSQLRKMHISVMRRDKSRQLQDPFMYIARSQPGHPEEQRRNQSEQLMRMQTKKSFNSKDRSSSQQPTIQHTQSSADRNDLPITPSLESLQPDDLRPWATAIEEHEQDDNESECF